MIKRTLIMSAIVSTICVGTVQANETGRFFVDAIVGVGSIDISKSDNKDTIELTNDSKDDSGTNIGIGLGYKYNNNIFTTIEYTNLSLDNATINNFLVGVNYQFDDIFLKPYVGVSVGYSMFEWDNSPITNPEKSKLDSAQNLYGVQAGIETDIAKDFAIFAQCQLLFQEHSTYITSPVHDTTILHQQQNNLSMGIKYYF